MGMLSGLFSGFGLSAAAGLNAFLPLLTVGILARFDLIQLQAPFSLLTHPLVLLIIAALAVLEFIGDKVPVVDHALHTAGLVVHPIAGAVLFVAANSSIGSVDPTLAAIGGLVMAGSAHLARSALRTTSTAATGGTANPVLSFAEDATSLVLTVLAILLPVLAFIIIIVLAFVVWRVLRPLLRTWRKA